MKRKIFFIVIFLLVFYLLFIIYTIIDYTSLQYKNKNIIKYCLYADSKICSKASFELIIPRLLIYKIKRNNKILHFAKLTIDPIWIPFICFENSRAFIYYADFVDNIKKYNFNFYRDFVYGNFGLEIYSFSKNKNTIISFPLPYDTHYAKKGLNSKDILEQLDLLKAEKKNVILHLSITNIDNDFLNSLIFKYAEIINGINIFIELKDQQQMLNAYKFFGRLQNDFVLVSRNSVFKEPKIMDINARFNEEKSSMPLQIKTKLYKGNLYNSTYILTYINKGLIDEYNISLEQNPEKIFIGEKVRYYRTLIKPPKSDIHWVVTFTEIVKQKLEKWKKRL